MKLRRAWAAMLVGCALTSGGDLRADPMSVGSVDPRVANDTAVLQRFRPIFDVNSVAIPESHGASVEARADRYRQFIHAAMREDSFYPPIVSRLLKSMLIPAVPFVNILKRTKIGGRDAYYLDEPACKAGDLVSVRPWWDLTRPISICKDDVRPEVRTGHIGQREVFCEATLHFQKTECRCGPNLINCARDGALAKDVDEGYGDEVIFTVADVIRQNRPFTDILTANETVRDGYAEFFYARNAFYQTGKLEYAAPTHDRRSRPRPAAFTGGVLTTPGLRFAIDSPRVIVASTWQDLLCVPLASTNVDAHTLLSFQNPDLRQHNLLMLASQPGCRDCHARLEYGIKGFKGFDSAVNGMRFVPNPADATTRFYVRGANDQRGEGPATPAWIGQTLANQPEFSRCMVDKIERLFYGGDPVPAEIDSALLDRFRADKNMGKLLEDSFVARYVGEVRAHAVH